MAAASRADPRARGAQPLRLEPPLAAAARARLYEFSIAAPSPARKRPSCPQGIFVVPGRYESGSSVDGKAVTQSLEVAADPRSRTPPSGLDEQLAF
jgi:hypothetical protein